MSENIVSHSHLKRTIMHRDDTMRDAKHALADTTLSLKIPAMPSTDAERAPRHTPVVGVLYEGWLLKKRRKKLQGYARRYFVLHSSGILAYSFEPGSQIRDQISLPGAVISSSVKHRDIHVDSSRVTFHIKCLSREDFDVWMAALRKFTASGSDDKFIGRKSLSKASQLGAIHHATIIVDEMANTINDLTQAWGLADDDDRRSRVSVGKHKDKESNSLLSIFKKTTPASPRRSSFAKEVHTVAPSLSNEHQIPALLDKLRHQHKSLSDSLMSVSALHNHPKSPLQRTMEEEGGMTSSARSSQLWQSMHLRNRSSISTMLSGTDGSGSIWYDAAEGDEFAAEEFVLEEDERGEDTSGGGENNSRREADSSIEKGRDTDDDYELAEDDTPEEQPILSVDRRTRLPSRPPGDEGSLFAVLKKNVGQDLANVSFPVTFNEPLTLLQRSAEDLEYYNLLDQAASSSDWIERIGYVAAFAVSGYACTKHRSGRKGFTPLLGETFEDGRMHFIAEKVVHKPLVIAYHAEGSGWELTATSSGKTKFWGKSFEIIPTGITRLKIGQEEFEWNKPSSFTRNLMMGTKYLEHCGEMTVKNVTSGASCVLDFKETGYWASTPNVVAGSVYSPDGNVVSRLEGKWDEQFSQKLDANHLKILWRVSPFPRDCAEFYGYTYFAITLNEITRDIQGKLPCTDSRFRPDVRALEEGNVELAEEKKAELEQKQRDRRQMGQERKPRWFRQASDSDSWEYIGGYWEARKNGWKNTTVQPLW